MFTQPAFSAFALLYYNTLYQIAGAMVTCIGHIFDVVADTDIGQLPDGYNNKKQAYLRIIPWVCLLFHILTEFVLVGSFIT